MTEDCGNDLVLQLNGQDHNVIDKEMEMHSLLQECRLNAYKGKRRHPAALSVHVTSAKSRGTCRLPLPPLYLQGASRAWWPVAGPCWVTSEHSELSRVGIASLAFSVFSCSFHSSCFILSKNLFLASFYTFLLLTTLKFIFSYFCASFKIPPNSTTSRQIYLTDKTSVMEISFLLNLFIEKLKRGKFPNL